MQFNSIDELVIRCNVGNLSRARLSRIDKFVFHSNSGSGVYFNLKFERSIAGHDGG